MDSREFWDDCPRFLESYALAKKMQDKHKLCDIETSVYLAGIYNRFAIASVLDKHTHYPEQLLLYTQCEEQALTDTQRQQRAEDEMRAYLANKSGIHQQKEVEKWKKKP